MRPASVPEGGRTRAHRPAFRRIRQALQESDRGCGGGGPRRRANLLAPGRPPWRRPAGTPAQPTAVAANQPPAEAPRRRRVGTVNRSSPEPPPPPPASLVGVWKAQASPDVAIALTLEADGKFAWEVDTKGNKQTLNGVAGFKDHTLALLQQDGPPLVGKVTQDGANKFVFAPDGAGTSAGAYVYAITTSTARPDVAVRPPSTLDSHGE